MRAQPSFVSESGARFRVGMGCPSFGGQRTDSGGSTRLCASLVTGLRPSLSGNRLLGRVVSNSGMSLERPEIGDAKRVDPL
jgi:hypothetical protein